MNDKLRARLEDAAERYRQLAERMGSGSPDVNMGALAKELGALDGLVGKYQAYQTLEASKKEAQDILEDASSDRDLRELAEAELDETAQKLSDAEGELIKMFVMEDRDANRNVIMEIRAGTGGEEAALFAADLFRMYVRCAEAHRWKVEVLDSSVSDLEGYREIIFSISGQGVYGSLRYESGGHRVQRVPVTETSGRIHTSAATVAVLPEVEDVDVEIDPEDIRMDFYRASGPGGQKVNKTSSAVRLTHEPTGTVVTCQDEKSQHKNRTKAMRILRSRVYEKMKTEREKERAETRKHQIGSGDRNDRIRTYNFPQNRVTDHRVGLTLYDLENVMLGQIDGILEALIAEDAVRRMEDFLGD